VSAIPVDRILLTVVTPERKVLEETVDEVVLPGSEGYLGVLPGHAPLLTGLKSGEASFRQGQSWRRAFVARGFAEVLPNRVSILADVGERAEEIDMERARAARERAQERLKSASGDLDWDRATAALGRALARLQIAGGR
jgi:F-type H+-transporting ATPase subunit epsilon